MILKSAMLSDQGLVRDKNQDAAYKKNEGNAGLFVVADGMGGHSKGEVASSAIVLGIAKWWEQYPKNVKNIGIKDVVAACENAIRRTNDEIFQQFSAENMVGGSTLVVLIIWGTFYATLSVGDSRIYQWKEKQLKQITVDDVWENLPEIRDNYSQQRIQQDESYGKLTMAVGVRTDLEIRTRTNGLREKELFLLCSDGIYKFCDEKVLNEVMKNWWNRHNPEHAIKIISDIVRENGARDNYSLIICLVDNKVK